MIYGKTNVHMVRDVTDLIGIRTLILRQYWSIDSDNPTQADLDARKPAAPSVPGGLLIMGEQTMKERGRYATLWTYQGINGDGKSVTFKDRKNSLDYGFDPGFAQVPIQLHRDFTRMKDQFQGYPSNDGTTVIWPPELSGESGSGTSKEKAATGETNPMFGIQAHFEMEGIYRHRYAERDLPGDLQRGVGFIADNLPGRPPRLEDGRNWLKAPTAYQRKGYVFDITEYYWLSRRGGWPEPVYRKGFFGGGGTSGGGSGSGSSGSGSGSGGGGLDAPSLPSTGTMVTPPPMWL
jgi:hypothetical protein